MKSLQTQGIALPRLGLGTFRMQGAACQAAVESALALGYHHIDTSEMYGNEDDVGAAIAASGIARRDLHVTTKVWHDHLAPEAIQRAFDASLDRRGLDQVDLYLVHWPAADTDLPAVLSTLMRLKDEGRTRAIGVASFMLRQAIEEIDAPIACNQVEHHVFLDQTLMLHYLRSKAIPLIAHCPLAQGQTAENSELARIGEKHGASAARVALKWLLDQDGIAAIPKAGRAASQRANFDALSLTLDAQDRRVIASLPKDLRLVNPPSILRAAILGRAGRGGRQCRPPRHRTSRAHDAHAREIADHLAPLGLRWWCESRVDALMHFSDETWRRLKNAGLTMVFCGAESGNNEVLKKMQASPPIRFWGRHRAPANSASQP